LKRKKGGHITKTLRAKLEKIKENGNWASRVFRDRKSGDKRRGLGMLIVIHTGEEGGKEGGQIIGGREKEKRRLKGGTPLAFFQRPRRGKERTK